MIYGIGTDIVKISRIQLAIDRHHDRFAEKILGTQELAQYYKRRAKIEERGIRFLATRFAAKEAFSKAIGLGMQAPMTWQAMETLNATSGRPLVLTSGALTGFMEQNRLSAQISITDEAEYAVAFVVVEKI